MLLDEIRSHLIAQGVGVTGSTASWSVTMGQSVDRPAQLLTVFETGGLPDELHESNPMLGHRGCRLGVTYPEIYEMQARAIFEAALDVAKETGKAPVPEIMIPLVATKRELELMRASVVAMA